MLRERKREILTKMKKRKKKIEVKMNKKIFFVDDMMVMREIVEKIFCRYDDGDDFLCFFMISLSSRKRIVIGFQCSDVPYT